MQLTDSEEKKPLILVIDDDTVLRKLVCSALRRAGFETAEGCNGKKGLKLIEELSPDLVILDVLMPDTDGFTVCTNLRDEPDSAHLPVLMVTGLNDTKSIEQAYDSGATDFMAKPVNFSLLPYRVLYMLKASASEQDLLAAYHRVNEANIAKSAFLTTMSHELRTPLNAILGFSDIMKGELLGTMENAKYLGYSKDIHESAGHLLQVINDILDLSKVEMGKIEVAKDSFELSESIDKVIRLVDPHAKDSNLEVSLEVDTDVPTLWSDEVRLMQVLINLLSNAVKFTPEGGQIRVSAWRSNQGGFAILVEDSGVGIPPDQIERALKAFEQIDNGLDRQHEGTGLGLSLAKALTELLGGTFTLTSEVGVGTRATLKFPEGCIATDEEKAVQNALSA